ncbi:pyridoxal-phosphate dependent enzyme [Dactylosporangium sp. NPDC051485]|uniref:pyridoxal-phosphate dependent enzyme n=1 Tax=Dactylosporangium sp. NPDC051485 TaxID=3154846 RepID=UPI003437BAC6
MMYAPELDDHVLPATVRSPLLESQLGVAEAWLVDCTGFGTGTFKDLEAAVVIAGAREMGLTRISVHSTGNTALSYRQFAVRAGLPCACYVPRQNADKLGDITADPAYPVFLVDTSFPKVAKVAKDAAARDGRHHLAPVGWKLEGKASLAWWLYETAPQVDLIVQTVAGGYGPLGYETGFRRLSRAVDHPHGILKNRRYLLFQPADADTLTRAWQAGHRTLAEEELNLPDDPFEPTLQSTNPVATLPLLRQQMPDGTVFRAVTPVAVEEARPLADKVLAEAGIALDYERERSAYISLAGLLTSKLERTTKLAFIVSGSRPFQHRESADAWHVLLP